MTALDTGFFLRLLEGHEEAGALWRALAEGEGEGVVSGLSLVELLRLGLKGALAKEDAELLLQAIPAVFKEVACRARKYFWKKAIDENPR